jgi:uncharacterized protein (DUF111 family)
MERLYAAGAREVYLTPVIMKKSRPGVVMTVICDHDRGRIPDILFGETTTLGLRVWPVDRLKLPRRISRVKTPYGPVRIKTAVFHGQPRYSIEYDDLKKIARRTGQPIRELRSILTKTIEKTSQKTMPGVLRSAPGKR